MSERPDADVGMGEDVEAGADEVVGVVGEAGD
jgi:hypothetical protein